MEQCFVGCLQVTRYGVSPACRWNRRAHVMGWKARDNELGDEEATGEPWSASFYVCDNGFLAHLRFLLTTKESAMSRDTLTCLLYPPGQMAQVPAGKSDLVAQRH